MSGNVTAEVISIGTEILLGELTDTNSVFIARALRDLGINLFKMASIGDNRKRIADAVGLALEQSHVVITCGGLGPTVDDMTRQSVADATGRDLTFHQSLLDQIADRFKNFGVTMTENNRQQAYLPDGAVVIENPVGTAPAFIVEQDDRCVICLPGVPREMKYLMTEQVIPYLREKYNMGVIKARILKSAGIGESALDEMIGRDLLENPNPTIGLAAHMGQIDVRITAKAQTEAEVDTMIAETESAVMAKAGRFIFGTDEETLEDVFVALLERHNASISVVYAGLDDVIVQALQAVEGGEDHLVDPKHYADPRALAVAYGVDPTMSLRELAQLVATKTAETTTANAVIVALSLPDVDEGADTEESTVIGVYTAEKYRDRVYGFGARSDFAHAWGKSWLLSTTWRLLKEKFEG